MIKYKTVAEELEGRLKQHCISQYKLAADTGINKSTISLILSGQARITAEISVKLGVYFRDETEDWAFMQVVSDLRGLRTDKEFCAKVRSIVPIAAICKGPQ